MKRKLWILSKLNGLTLNIGCGNLKIDGAVNLYHNFNVKPGVLADFHNLPFRDKTFEYSVGFDVIEHSQHPRQVVNEMERVSRRQVIEALNFDKCPENWRKDPTHKYYINKETLRKMRPDYQIFEINRMLFALKGIKIRFPYLKYLIYKVRMKWLKF